jgi:hypothetical protein
MRGRPGAGVVPVPTGTRPGPLLLRGHTDRYVGLLRPSLGRS